MKKKETEIFKNLVDKVFPSIASAGSILALLYFLTTLFDKSSQYFEFSIAILASITGAVIAFFALKVLRKKREGNVFVLYSHKDKKFVEKLVQSLKFKRFNIYYDEEVLNIGDNIKETILLNIKKSDVIVLVLSKESEKDNFISYELKAAKENHKKILPVIIDTEGNIPDEIKNLKYADFTKDYEISVRQLAKSLVNSIEEKSSSQQRGFASAGGDE